MLDSNNSRSSAPASLPATSPLLLLLSSRHYQHRQRPRDLSLNGVAKNRSQSAGSNWEAEFAQYSDAEQSQKASQHLELTWKVHKNAKPAPCSHCEGVGHEPCPWCNSTGAMRIGEHVFCSIDSGCKPCPICNSKGRISCKHCMGTGFRASWLSP
ncbi:g720 [Coccomyxa viridis]|uniref:G720 protein n=1 Tax=Coccomyxa viridis TaxID=1274662 RepID=A0ABP1FI14_9CHLO